MIRFAGGNVTVADAKGPGPELEVRVPFTRKDDPGTLDVREVTELRDALTDYLRERGRER